MSIVPKFSLFQDHRCPDPHPELYEAPVNIVSRHHRKSYGVPYGGQCLLGIAYRCLVIDKNFMEI